MTPASAPGRTGLGRADQQPAYHLASADSTPGRPGSWLVRRASVLFSLAVRCEGHATDKEGFQQMTAPAPVPATTELLRELQHIYAETLEIPIDEVTAEADLAADLGADSLTQVELMDLVLKHYGMLAVAGNIQAMSYPTIGAMAELIQWLSDKGHGSKASRPDD
jgi:acyl carrier protein